MEWMFERSASVDVESAVISTHLFCGQMSYKQVTRINEIRSFAGPSVPCPKIVDRAFGSFLGAHDDYSVVL